MKNKKEEKILEYEVVLRIRVKGDLTYSQKNLLKKDVVIHLRLHNGH